MKRKKRRLERKSLASWIERMAVAGAITAEAVCVNGRKL